LTRDEANDFLPVWTPDSKRIIFGSERDGNTSIYWKAADGTGKVEQIASIPDGWIWPTSLSRDGNTLFFGQVGDVEAGLYNLGMLSMEGDRTPKLLLQEEYSELQPMISTDGRWLAYGSNESGADQIEVYVRPFPEVESGGKWQVSTSGGSNPLWSPDGRTLFYVGPDGAMAVPVETDPSFILGTPKNLFSGPYLDWDISPDGKRFLMVKPLATTGESSTEESTQAGPRKINIVLNWFEELKERAPTD
jgi:serine/threonine-protein kinase